MGHLERALFVIGDQNTGKSTQLRSMFLDVRLQNGGIIPSGKQASRLPEAWRLSNERWLYLRLTSPHEANESLSTFLKKTDGRFKRWRRFGERWNFAGAIQPLAAKKMPDAVPTIDAFIKRFAPERTRAVFLSPDRHGTPLNPNWLKAETAKLWTSNIAVACVDAGSRTANGLFLADFFDFT